MPVQLGWLRLGDVALLPVGVEEAVARDKRVGAVVAEGVHQEVKDNRKEALQDSIGTETLQVSTGVSAPPESRHRGSERLEDQVAEEVPEDVPPEANDEVGRQLGEPGLDHVGRVPKGSTELAVGMRTYFLPVFCLPGLMSTDLKKAKAYSTGLLA